MASLFGNAMLEETISQGAALALQVIERGG